MIELLVKLFLLIVLPVLAAAGVAIVRDSVSLVDPPGPIKRLLTYLGTNSARTRPNHPFPELRTRVYPLAAEPLAESARQATADLGWRAEQTGDPHKLHAVAVSPWLRFRDDISIELQAAGQARTRVHIASRSRLGRADFGANIRHIADYYDALTARAGRPAPVDPP